MLLVVHPRDQYWVQSFLVSPLKVWMLGQRSSAVLQMIHSSEEWVMYHTYVLQIRWILAGKRTGQRGTSWGSSRGNAKSCKLGRNDPMHQYMLEVHWIKNSSAERDTGILGLQVAHKPAITLTSKSAIRVLGCTKHLCQYWGNISGMPCPVLVSPCTSEMWTSRNNPSTGWQGWWGNRNTSPIRKGWKRWDSLVRRSLINVCKYLTGGRQEEGPRFFPPYWQDKRKWAQIKICFITCLGFILPVGLNPLPQCWSGCHRMLFSPLVTSRHINQWPTHVSTQRISFSALSAEISFYFFTIIGSHYLYTPWDNYSFGHVLWSFFCCQRVWVS